MSPHELEQSVRSALPPLRRDVLANPEFAEAVRLCSATELDLLHVLAHALLPLPQNKREKSARWTPPARDIVQSVMTEIARRQRQAQQRQELVRKFKREMRACRKTGLATVQAFARLWHEILESGHFADAELGKLHRELLRWTRRTFRLEGQRVLHRPSAVQLGCAEAVTAVTPCRSEQLLFDFTLSARHVTRK